MAKITKEIIVYTNSYNMDVCLTKRELLPTMIEEHDLLSFADWLGEEDIEFIIEALQRAVKRNESAASAYNSLMNKYDDYVDNKIEELLSLG